MQMTPVSFWFRMVSSATAVLPVWRSPMISSRWPRPIGTMPSMALRPVCIGSRTGWRSTTPGASRSIGANFSVRIGPLPSIGWPSALTTRPSISSPTGTEMMRPVRLTGSPSLISRYSPRSTAPMLSSSRFSAMPITPCGELEHLAGHRPLAAVEARDAVADRIDRADLGDVHVDGEAADLVPDDLGNLVGSNAHGHLALGDQLVAHLLQLRPHAAVVHGAAHTRHDAAEQRGSTETRIVICLPVALLRLASRR